MIAPISAGETAGRAAVVDQDDSFARRRSTRRRLHGDEAGQTGGHRLLAAGAAGDHGHDLGRQPRRVPGGLDGVRGHDHDEPVHLGRGRERGQRPGQQRPIADRGQQLVDPGHPAGRARGDDDRIGSTGRA